MNIEEIEERANSMAPGDAMDFLLRELQKRAEIFEEFIALQRAFRCAHAATKECAKG